MRNWLLHPIDSYQEGRRRKAREYLQQLKTRYHIFRGLLDYNTRAVTLITELGVQLGAPGPSPASLASRIDELLEVTGQMVEKMLRLGGERYQRLIGIHRRIEADIRAALGTLPSLDGLPFCLPLAETGPELYPAIGGKSAKLARLRQESGYGVPDGFVIPVHACRLFLEQEDLALRILGHLRQQLTATPAGIPDHLLEETRREILQAPLPPTLEEALRQAAQPFFSPHRAGLAVRSSAIGEDSPEHSFAGQYSTVLNVTDLESLFTAFKTVVASSFSARSLAYRLNAGIDPLAFDMAVLCLEMVPARASGILLTRDPNAPGKEQMLVSAAYGLGEQVVAGTSAADLYLLPRGRGTAQSEIVVAKKERRLVCAPGGENGTREEAVPGDEQEQPVLSSRQLSTLREWGLAIERQEKMPQDIEWALDQVGELHLLQTRPLKLTRQAAVSRPPGLQSGEVLFTGTPTSGGRATGQVFVARSRQDLEALPAGPVVLVLHQSLVEAARFLPEVHGVLVDFGNPADHLSCVAREYGVPMLSGLATATRDLRNGTWVTVDGRAGNVLPARPEEVTAARTSAPPEQVHRKNPPAGEFGKSIETLRERVVTLNLTDAYGSTFSILECRSLHDVVRFIHEKAVLAMFHTSDELLEKTTGAVFHLETEVPFSLSIIDLGGGLLPKVYKRRIAPPDIISLPFRALWRGLADPGLHWGPPPGGAGINSVVSKWLVDHASERPIGMPNYVLLTRDYLNLNARMEFHFTMVDTVCGQDARSNYIKFRFKGGGTSAPQRRRRAACIALILQHYEFFTDLTDDLVTGDLQGLPQPLIEERLTMVGRLLGFTRLLDAAMGNDEMPPVVAQAFLEGDYRLQRLEKEDLRRDESKGSATQGR